MTKEEKTIKKFNILIKLALSLYVLILILAVIFKSFMVDDVIASFNFLSNFTLSERFNRGINLIDFYKLEYQLGVIRTTIILDVLNCIIFIPFGIFVSHFIKKHKVLYTLLITLFVSLSIELFQLFTIIGSFMLNDLLTNVLGGIIGCILYVLITKNNKYSLYNILLSIFVVIETMVAIYLVINFVINIDVYKDLLVF